MMKLIVEKYGGTSIESIDRIKSIASHAVDMSQKGYKLVIVVSAMGKTTDDLVNIAGQITPRPRQRELSMLLSTGEVVSSSLLAMAIQAMGQKSTSLTGAQSGIHTEGVHSNARITDIDTSRIKSLLEQDEIIVIAGYQGKIGDDITVLGRGGSDASAVALAAALGADQCHIYTDVDGVYTADPRIVKDASLLEAISYEEMIELAGSGAGVMMGRAVEIARKYDMPVRVCSSFNNSTGTLITKENEMEKVVITGVAVNKDVAMIDIKGINAQTSTSADILGQIAEREINIILLSSNRSDKERMNLSIVVSPHHVSGILEILDHFIYRGKIESVNYNSRVEQVSIVGSGIATNCGVAYQMFNVLALNDIEILMSSTSEIKISAIVPRGLGQRAVSALHNEFKLNGLQRKFFGQVLN